MCNSAKILWERSVGGKFKSLVIKIWYKNSMPDPLIGTVMVVRQC